MNLEEVVGILLKARHWYLCTAESCTGGMLSQVITSVPGSSEYFDRGFITYSNASKIEILGVSSESIEKYGAVSEEVALEMAEGALIHSQAQVSVSITGIAGPLGGSEKKPVGTVFIVCKTPLRTRVGHYVFEGEREAVRLKSVETALEILREELCRS